MLPLEQLNLLWYQTQHAKHPRIFLVDVKMFHEIRQAFREMQRPFDLKFDLDSLDLKYRGVPIRQCIGGKQIQVVEEMEYR